MSYYRAIQYEFHFMGSPKSTFAQKVDWMVKNQAIWGGWPACRLTDVQIMQLMVADGLVSAKSHDIGDFGRLVATARDEIRKRKQSK